MLLSEQFTRRQLSEQLALKGKELTAAIRELKRIGKLVQRRVYVDPTISNKKVTVFNYAATNLELPIS